MVGSLLIMRKSQANKPSEAAGSICTLGSIFNHVIGSQYNNYTIIINQTIV